MTRSLGTDEHPACVKCGSLAYAVRRGPGADHGALFKRQRFECAKCNFQFERSATSLPYVDPMREPAVQGWVNSGLVAPN
jgi:hypothetical protein